jgi:hypothetical protein
MTARTIVGRTFSDAEDQPNGPRAVLLAIAGIATLHPSWMASRTDPVRTLRQE